MQLATGHDLSISFVTRQLFSGVNFSVQSNARIGLVGMNGCGKTTLFKLMGQLLKPDTGEVVYHRDTRLAYMEQFLLADEDMTLYEAVLKVFDDLTAMEVRLDEINRLLEQAHTPGLLSEQQRLQEQYADRGGYTYAMRLRATLLGLGFEERDFALPVRALSGGQRSKAALAKVLLAEANLLLLDEPTNHLDIDSIEWLEGFLGTYKGAFIVISHDRYFLDKVTNETWAMENGGIRCFGGNYSAHLEMKESEDESRLRQYQNQQREIRRIEGIVAQQKRFNQARNYVTIASKQKQIERLKADLVQPKQDEKTLAFHFTAPPPGGNDVLEVHGVAKRFGPKKLFSHANLKIQKGEKIFLLGMNGCGKTTLLRIIMNQETPDQGTVRFGANIIPVYYDQIQSRLKGTENLLAHLTNSFPRLTQTRLRTLLGSFLFPGESVEKSIDALSGGEKARLELLKLIMEPANLLLLDEPTNHLDIASREAVEKALISYPGAMLVVSHDRYLINRLADRIYYMSGDGLTECLGNYDDYLEMIDKGTAKTTPDQVRPDMETDQFPPVVSDDSGVEYRRRKEEKAQFRRVEKKRARLKEEIRNLEGQIDMLDDQIDACAAADYQILMEFSSQKEILEEQLLCLLEQMEILRQKADDFEVKES